MNKILEMKFGSHLYGTDTPNSDLDYKGVYLPTAREIVLHNYKKTIATCRPKGTCERNTKDDVDTEFFSLDRYLELLIEGQTVALDMLFGYEVGPDTGIMDTIYLNRNKLLSKNVNAFIGYARQQAAKYGIKGSRMDALKVTSEFLDSIYRIEPHSKLFRHESVIVPFIQMHANIISLEKTPLIELVTLKGPTGLIDQPHLRINGRAIPLHSKVSYAIEIVEKMLDSYGQRAHKAHLDGGKDWKALSHAVRVASEAVELLTTGHITLPRPDRELLLKIKTNQLPYEQVAEMIEQGLVDLYVAQEKSVLRESPDQEWVDNFVYEIYSDIVKKG